MRCRQSADHGPLPPLDRPNWVSSDAPPGPRRVEPFRLAARPDDRPWTLDAIRAVLVETLRTLPRARVDVASPAEVVAEFRSALFRFVDDARFDLRPESETIGLFSGSRTRFLDLGANRRRLETIRRRLVKRGLLCAPGEEEDAAAPPGREAVSLPIDGTLDLHTFDPREVDRLLPDYFEACRARGLFEVRVVHGKGRGILKARVLALLDRLEVVAGHRPAGEEAGGWGATLVTLRPPPAPPGDRRPI
ncbi:MAG TPA: Smr/MutS family protein [Dongiaceae bacterium]|nr:Smr/MutS family protein [Dongiaceae bacterium]